MAGPNLTVIDGGATPATAWLDFPRQIRAPSPFDRNESCLFRVACEDAIKAARAANREPAFLLWSALFGRAPPVNGMASLPDPDQGLGRLEDAHACFQGVRRPIGADNAGDGFIAYVMKPRFVYEYVPSMSVAARRLEVDADLVFVAYARLDIPHDGLAKGILTHWQFVEAGDDRLLPVEHDLRYVKRLW